MRLGAGLERSAQVRVLPIEEVRMRVTLVEEPGVSPSFFSHLQVIEKTATSIGLTRSLARWH